MRISSVDVISTCDTTFSHSISLALFSLINVFDPPWQEVDQPPPITSYQRLTPNSVEHIPHKIGHMDHQSQNGPATLPMSAKNLAYHYREHVDFDEQSHTGGRNRNKVYPEIMSDN